MLSVVFLFSVEVLVRALPSLSVTTLLEGVNALPESTVESDDSPVSEAAAGPEISSPDVTASVDITLFCASLKVLSAAR